MSILVTGVAGFIGMHVARALLDRGETVVGLDNLNAYYDPALKEARIAQLSGASEFTFHKVDLSDRDAVFAVVDGHKDLNRIVHLGAQAGVRYSLSDPYAYVQSNVMGHLVMLEAARRLANLQHLVYASSSSVYGANTSLPFSVEDRVDQPVSLYAATKRADELISACYAHLHDLPMTGLRFFTVYGPWGRPDMSPWLFTEAVLTGRPIHVFNEGHMQRDFTYVGDVVAGVLGALDRVPDGQGAAGHRLFNLGNNVPVPLLDYIQIIEDACGRKAEKIMEPMQDGDVVATWADIDASRAAFGYAPRTVPQVGIPIFVEWFRSYTGL